MLTIIVCYYREERLANLTQSIHATVGIEHEIIAINNQTGEYGICRAYNRGVLESKYDYLCFVHEDVIFETVGWGELVVNHLKDPSIGLIGVAGGVLKSAVPSSWAPFIYQTESCYYQHFNEGGMLPVLLKSSSSGILDSRPREVVAIDGMWICARKSIFNRIRFDEVNFPGFHGYDVDISLQASHFFKNAVVFDILLHHFSEGNYNKEWLQSCVQVSRKWKEHLPAHSHFVSDRELMRQHWTVMKIFVDHLKRLRYSKFRTLRYVVEFGAGRFFDLRSFVSTLKGVFLP